MFGRGKAEGEKGKKKISFHPCLVPLVKTENEGRGKKWREKTNAFVKKVFANFEVKWRKMERESNITLIYVNIVPIKVYNLTEDITLNCTEHSSNNNFFPRT